MIATIPIKNIIWVERDKYQCDIINKLIQRLYVPHILDSSIVMGLIRKFPTIYHGELLDCCKQNSNHIAMVVYDPCSSITHIKNDANSIINILTKESNPFILFLSSTAWSRSNDNKRNVIKNFNMFINDIHKSYLNVSDIPKHIDGFKHLAYHNHESPISWKKKPGKSITMLQHGFKFN